MQKFGYMVDVDDIRAKFEAAGFAVIEDFDKVHIRGNGIDNTLDITLPMTYFDPIED